MGTTCSRICSHLCTEVGGGMDTTCGFGNGRGELNLGFDEDAAVRECHGMLLDDNPPLQWFVENAGFLAG